MSLVKPNLSVKALKTVRDQVAGILCVYKPADLHYDQVIRRIKGNLVRDFNSLLIGQDVMIDKLQASHALPISSLVVEQIPKRFFLGEKYTTDHFRLSAVDPPCKFASGVMVLGLGKGTRELESIKLSKFLKVIEVRGELGIATDDHTTRRKVVDRARFQHVRREQLERLLAAIQAQHQRLQFECSGLDLRSEAAFEMACRGPVRPPIHNGRSQPLIYNIRCTDFTPPHFTLEIHCIGDTPMFFPRLIHDLGLDLRCVATCSGIRVVRHGMFSLQHALLRSDWNAASFIQNSRLCAGQLQKSRELLKDSQQGSLAWHPPV